MRLFTITLILVITKTVYGQVNLVPNPSFEDTVSCPNNYGQILLAIGWNSPTQYGTPDYFNDCSSTLGTNNIIGSQLPKTGNGYAGILTFFWNGANYLSGVEYLQSRLIDSLEYGKTYNVSFYVSLADSVVYNCNNFGIYFSADSIYSTTDTLLPFTPQITNNLSNSLADKENWTLITGSFTAAGSEKYLILGNFTPLADVDTSYVGNGKQAFNRAYYFVDDVSVLLDTTVGISELPIEKYKFSLYPNPNSGKMMLDYSIQPDDKEEILFYDITGKLVASYILDNKDNKLTIINERLLNDGFYTYHIVVNNSVVKSEKLIIRK